MKIMIHAPGPWNPSGYGVQAALLARGLRDAGHEVTFSAYGGFVQPGEWEGIPLLSCGASPHGVGAVAGNYHRSGAEVMISVCDFWLFDHRELAGMTVMPWIPIDAHGLGWRDHATLAGVAETADLIPVAMSQFGQKVMAGAGFDSVFIPHGVLPEYRPGDRTSWREEAGIAKDEFLISMVAVNNGLPDRKGFDTALCAFQIFHERHPEARLYMHTIPQHKGGLDLYRIMESLGLNKCVGFPETYKRVVDLYDSEWMARMYRAADVTVLASRGEGFGVPIIESFACGTPVVGSRCTSGPELIPSNCGWLCDVQPQWCTDHQSWWHTPIIGSLAEKFELAFLRAASMRQSAAAEGRKYSAPKVISQWVSVLAQVESGELESIKVDSPD